MLSSQAMNHISCLELVLRAIQFITSLSLIYCKLSLQCGFSQFCETNTEHSTPQQLTMLIVLAEPLHRLHGCVVALSKEQNLEYRLMEMRGMRCRISASKEPTELRNIMCNQIRKCSSNTHLFEAPTSPPRASSCSMIKRVYYLLNNRRRRLA